jgi:acyl carrier protein
MSVTAGPTQGIEASAVADAAPLNAAPLNAAARHVQDDLRWDEILGIVAKETRIDRARLTPDASIEALGITSLDMVQTVFEIESHYDVEIPVLSDRAGSEFATVGDLVAHVIAALDRARAG